MRIFSYLLVVAGLVFLSYGGYEWFSSQKAQSQATAEAQSIIEERNDETINAKDLAAQFNPLNGETAGILHIPKLDAELPIIEGTDPDDLERGVGHYQGTAYPLQDEQIVLSGHRDTVFRDMGELEIGDHLVIQLEYGDFTYEITETKIVDADDRTIIVPHGEEVLTLTTCYPFTYVGYAPDRYIMYAYPIDQSE